MNKRILALGITGLAAAGFAVAAVVYDTTFNPRDRILQDVPTGHTPGKDNSTKADEHGLHMAGEDCGICHTPGGKADPNNDGKFVFTMAGTLYEDKAARKPLAGGEVILQDSTGKVISMTSNEVGNFWTYEPIASHPLSVLGKDANQALYTTDLNTGEITAAPADNSATWLYKVWVKKGDQYVSAPDVKPVGGTSAASARMGCAMHHGPNGSRGALWLSRKGTLDGYPESELQFKKHILPILMSRCASCHRPGATTSRLVMKSDVDVAFDVTKKNADQQSTQIDYSAMHDLTAYDDQGISTAWAKFGTGHYALGFESNPDQSKLLTKTTIGVTEPHGGGKYWDPEDADYKAIYQWIKEGAKNN